MASSDHILTVRLRVTGVWRYWLRLWLAALLMGLAVRLLNLRRMIERCQP